MDLELEDQQHTLADTVESSQAMNLDQGTGEGTANGGDGGAASTGGQVGEHLEPIDLLQITRVNKVLRHVFTSKKDSKRVWKLAFKNINFPHLKATDWDLINLASLLHEAPRCIACGKIGGSVVDFSCRLARHDTCVSPVYSTAAEIRGQTEDLHPETLSCVPSTRFSVGRRVEDHFVTSMVSPMNEYLHYLDSTIFSSRQRDTKKAARQARDAFLVEKKQNLSARSDDSDAIASWQRRLELQKREQEEQQRRTRWKAEEDRRRAENAAIASRIAERFEKVRRRLSALGHESVDINGIANHWQVKRQEPLTDTEWDSISTSVIDSVTQVKQRRLAAVQAEAERSRTQALRTLYQDVLRKTTGFERAAFPSFNVFLNLPTISSFRTGTTALTTDSWSLALPSIQTEVSGTRRLLKLAYARRLVKGLYAAGYPPPSTFVNALNPSGLSAVVQARTGEVSLTALNLNDPSTLTEQELDDFLDRFTSRAFWFSDGNRTRGGYGHKMERFPAIHAFTVPSSSERCAIAGPRASVPWIKVLFALLKSTGIEDGAVAEVDEKFKALGASFECRWGSCSSRGRLTFSELLVHVQQREHARFFNPHWREGKITVEDIVYVPNSVKIEAR